MSDQPYSQMEANPDFLTLAELAALLNVGRTTIYELAHQNALPIPVLRVGRQYRVSRRAYDALRNVPDIDSLSHIA